MSEKTPIQWTDSTVNFWSGCNKVSAGCQHCYAEALSKRGLGNVGQWGKGAPRRLHESAFTLAYRLNKKPWICSCGTVMCQEAGRLGHHVHRRRIFSLSLGDWLDPEVPVEWLARMLDTIRQCDQVTWILVTKRPELWQARLTAARDSFTKIRLSDDLATSFWCQVWLSALNQSGPLVAIPPKNVWLVASVENQDAADERIPHLLKIPAVVRGLSCEPLLGPIDLNRILLWTQQIDWIIVGGESGPKARPCNIKWMQTLVGQGQSAGIPVFVKQMGRCPMRTIEGGTEASYVLCLDKAKGGDPDEWPEYLRVREFPANR